MAASGRASLESGRLGVATERHFIDAYLEQASHVQGVLPKLIWLSLHHLDPSLRDLELNLFLSRKDQVTEEEIEAVAEVAFSWGCQDICQELLSECIERWHAEARRSGQSINDTFSSLEKSLPLLIAASLKTPAQGVYQRSVSKYCKEINWCTRRNYAKALARLCNVGDETSSIWEELRFLANQPGRVSFEAVDEIVRLACRDGFDPYGWIENPEARRSGLLRCYRIWCNQTAQTLADTPRAVSFKAVWSDRFGYGDEGIFIDSARSYFFSCLASVVEGRQPPDAVDLNDRASNVAMFLFLLRDLAIKAAASKEAGEVVGGAWLIDRLGGIDPSNMEANDLGNHLVYRTPMARIMVAIAQDLDDLHHAGTGRVSLTRDVVEAAINGAWTWASIWIEDRVERRLKMGESEAAELLIHRERVRLADGLDYLSTRAEQYASLAQFCHLHGRWADAKDFARLATRNLLGHGEHKDYILFDILKAIRVAAPSMNKECTLKHLQSISPVIRVVDDITDGDETRHLKPELAEVVAEVAPEALPPYLRALQRDQQHWVVESSFTDLVRTIPLETVFDKALAATLVHEEALTALQHLADKGDADAGLVLKNTLTYCGRQAATPERSDVGSPRPIEGSHEKLSLIENYPPDRLTEFLQAVRNARIIGDNLPAAWTNYWMSKDPKKLLAVLSEYLMAHGRPLENKTGYQVVKLALELSGPQAAMNWMIAYHIASSGWGMYYRLNDVTWIWEIIQTRFKNKWIEFIIATSRLRWGSAGGAPSWGIERMVRFLDTVGETNRIGEVLDAAVRWAAGLAADMRLPDPALTPDPPDVPPALRLLVDRLDCPSRMVQERAGWSLAELLADAKTRDVTTKAVLDWHAEVALELRSCTLLLILHLARTAHGTPALACVEIARQADLKPSIGVDLLLREFGNEGTELAESLEYRTQHYGCPTADFPGVENFDLMIRAYLSRCLHDQAKGLNESGIPFLRQWEWESDTLARQQGLSLQLDPPHGHHYVGGVDEGELEINDRISIVLRSAYLRALHWAIDQAKLTVDVAAIHARILAVMADPIWWAVRPTEPPRWWPADPEGADDGLDMLAEAVGQAVKNRLNNRGPNDEEVLLFAAGPVGNRPDFRAEVVVRAFFQSAHGPLKPSILELSGIPRISCRPIPPRMFLPGAYMTFEQEYAVIASGWLMAPLAWCLWPGTLDWLLPDRHRRGLVMPATWLFTGESSIYTEPEQVLITLGEHQVARYHYWNDDLRERKYLEAGTRVGAELLIQRSCLEPHLEAGASICYIVTLSIQQREKYEKQFSQPRTAGIWGIEGS
ncbi:MAG: hypothetical protein HQK58_02235 [Deltaproteobacteria bacterium]|nr:hypothetical protein [Deltaproteobacteria bacterium]